MKKKTIKESVDTVMKDVKRKSEIYITRCKPELKTGFPRIDECFKKGKLIVLAGIHRIGKTSFALDITRNLSLIEKKAVGYISMGMSDSDLIERLLGAESKIDGWRIRTGSIEDSDLERFEKTSEIISKSNIYIEDVASPSILDIKKIAEKLSQKKKIDLLVIDYLQLIYNKKGKTPMYITETVEKIKTLAVSLNIPVLLLVQVEEDASIFPMMTTLRRVGNLEKFANSILVIHRSYYNEIGIAELFIEKNDEGYTGPMSIIYDGGISTFKMSK